MKNLICVAVTVTAAAFGQQADPTAVKTAVEKGIAVLQPVGPTFFKKQGCVSCHNQALPAMVTSLAQARGFKYDQKLVEQELKTIRAFIKPVQEPLLEGSDVIPEAVTTGSYFLVAFAAQKQPADDMTTAIVHNVAGRQQPDGSWTGWAPRPPISYGDIRATAIAIRGISLYAPKGRQVEFDRRIERARNWMLNAKPATAEETIQKLMGLTWADAAPQDLKKAAQEVLDAQRPDGGWAQLETLESDAYATGEALVALHDSGVLTTSSPAYQRGVQFLLKTQYEDGSWKVKTRAFPFQPLVDSGFPHGRDQWISATGTGWAVMALMLTAEPQQTVASVRQ